MKYNLIPYDNISKQTSNKSKTIYLVKPKIINHNNISKSNLSKRKFNIGLKTGLSALGIGFVAAWWVKHKINNYFNSFNVEIKKQIVKKPKEVEISFIDKFKEKIIKEISDDPTIPHYAKIGVLTAVLAYVIVQIRKKPIKDGHGIQDTIVDNLSEIPENPFLKYPIRTKK